MCLETRRQILKRIKLLISVIIVLLFVIACSKVETNQQLPVVEELEVDMQSEDIVMITEEDPPLNYMEDGKITGPSVEIVQSIKRKLGVTNDIILLPWKRGFLLTENNINTCLFSTVRNEEREDMFKWIGPIIKTEFAFYAKKSANIKIDNLEEAKKYSIGVQNIGASEDFLLQNNFTNIEGTYEQSQNLTKLDAGRIDMWHIMTPTFEKLISEDPTIDRNDYEKVFITVVTELYIAFNQDTPDDITNAWQQAFDELYEDGEIEEILVKYNLQGLTP